MQIKLVKFGDAKDDWIFGLKNSSQNGSFILYEAYLKMENRLEKAFSQPINPAQDKNSIKQFL